MLRDAEGNKIFESSEEAFNFLQQQTTEIVRWLHQCREIYHAELPFFPQYRTRLNDISNVTRRYIASQDIRIRDLEARLKTALAAAGNPKG